MLSLEDVSEGNDVQNDYTCKVAMRQRFGNYQNCLLSIIIKITDWNSSFAPPNPTISFPPSRGFPIIRKTCGTVLHKKQYNFLALEIAGVRKEKEMMP